MFHARTKHIDVQYNFLHETLEYGLIVSLKIHTSESIADILTKPLAREKFFCSRASLGLVVT